MRWCEVIRLDFFSNHRHLEGSSFLSKVCPNFRADAQNSNFGAGFKKFWGKNILSWRIFFSVSFRNISKFFRYSCKGRVDLTNISRIFGIRSSAVLENDFENSLGAIDDYKPFTRRIPIILVMSVRSTLPLHEYWKNFEIFMKLTEKKILQESMFLPQNF